MISQGFQLNQTTFTNAIKNDGKVLFLRISYRKVFKIYVPNWPYTFFTYFPSSKHYTYSYGDYPSNYFKG